MDKQLNLLAKGRVEMYVHTHAHTHAHTQRKQQGTEWWQYFVGWFIRRSNTYLYMVMVNIGKT